MKEIKGRNALLTGASRGIGVSIAKTLAEEGVNLALVARTVNALEEVRDEIVRTGVRVIAVPADLSRVGSLETLVKTVERDLGPIDLLINNAAIENVGDYEKLDLGSIERVIKVNLIAPMILTRLVLPGMVARDRGHIVNISSADGILPVPFFEAYSTTKHGLIGFTYCLRLSFRIRKLSLKASAVCPGFVNSAGMYQRAIDIYGKKAEISNLFGTSGPQKVANAVVRAIRQDRAVVIVGRLILPIHLSLYTLPRLTEWVAEKSGWFDPFRYYVDAKSRRSS